MLNIFQLSRIKYEIWIKSTLIYIKSEFCSWTLTGFATSLLQKENESCLGLLGQNTVGVNQSMSYETLYWPDHSYRQVCFVTGRRCSSNIVPNILFVLKNNIFFFNKQIFLTMIRTRITDCLLSLKFFKLWLISLLWRSFFPMLHWSDWWKVIDRWFIKSPSK